MKNDRRTRFSLEAEMLLGAKMKEIKGAAGCGGKVNPEQPLKPADPFKPLKPVTGGNMYAPDEDEVYQGPGLTGCTGCNKSGCCMTATF